MAARGCRRKMKDDVSQKNDAEKDDANVSRKMMPRKTKDDADVSRKMMRRAWCWTGQTGERQTPTTLVGSRVAERDGGGHRRKEVCTRGSSSACRRVRRSRVYVMDVRLVGLDDEAC